MLCGNIKIILYTFYYYHMENYYTEFVKNLHKFLSDLNRYVPTKETQEFLTVFDKIDMGKVMLRYLKLMNENENRLKSRDETIFNDSFVILPGMDLSNIWKQLNPKQKDKIFTYLQILYIQAELILNNKEIEAIPEKTEAIQKMIKDVKTYAKEEKHLAEVKPDAKEEITTIHTHTESKSEEVKKEEKQLVEANPNLEFDPYVGIGNANEEYSAGEMFAGISNLPDEGFKPGLGSFAGMIGIDKMINIEELSTQLKNMKKEDIDEATKNIKSLLGNNVDDKTTAILSDMLTNITEELKKDTIGKGNPLDNIIRIAETVASKIKPKIHNENIDMSKLWSTTQNLAQNCKDENGNKLFQGGTNPLDLINKMMGATMGATMGGNTSQPMKEEDYLKNCNKMLKDMGIDNLDLSNMDFSNINFSNLQKKNRRRKK